LKRRGGQGKKGRKGSRQNIQPRTFQEVSSMLTALQGKSAVGLGDTPRRRDRPRSDLLKRKRRGSGKREGSHAGRRRAGEVKTTANIPVVPLQERTGRLDGKKRIVLSIFPSLRKGGFGKTRKGKGE